MPTEDFPTEIRAQLRSRRADCYLSYAEAAHMSGLSASTIKGVEGQRGHLTVKTLTALCRGYAVAAPTEGGGFELRPVLNAESVKSIANALVPLLDRADPDGSRTLLDYHSIVDALAAGRDPTDSAVDAMVRLVQGVLPPTEVIALTGDLADRIGSAAGTNPAGAGGFAGASPSIGPTPMQIGAILQSGLSEDTKQRLFSYVTRRNAEAVGGVESELESVIKLLRAEVEQRLR